MIKVMIVDHSAVVRQHMSALLTAGGLTVMATASDPIFAMQHMKQAWPDVLVLDVDMPRMDGITFLKHLMAERPTPVVMCSTLTEQGAKVTMQALSAGAVGFVTKPKLGLKDFLEDDRNGIVAAVKAAAKVNMGALRKASPVVSGPLREGAQEAMLETPSERVIAIGLSTGGVQTIEAVLTRLPRTTPGMLIVQHMPPNFTASLAARLNALCDLDVREAKDGDGVFNGQVLFAPGGRHMRLKRSGGQYVVEVFDGPLVNHHRPCVDVLFKSVAQAAGAHAIGVVMTGMGDDGAQGLKDLREAGAMTAAQDEASCVVFGMPKEALRQGGVQHVVSLADMPAWLMNAAATDPPASV
jgi:two-component system chemotaxis response regulator CheB